MGSSLRLRSLADYQRMVRELRVITLQGPIGYDMIRSFNGQIEDIYKRGNDPELGVLVQINSLGGDIDDGRVLMTQLEALSTDPNTYVVIHHAASMAPFLALAFPAERRAAFRHSVAYFHWSRLSYRTERSSFIPEEFEYAAKEHTVQITRFRDTNKWLITTLAARTLLNKIEASQLMKDPRELPAKEMVKLGIVSRILT